MNVTSLLFRCCGALERIGLRLKTFGWGKWAVGRLFIDALLYPSDLNKVYSSYHATFGRFPDIWHRETFNEWLQARKLFRRKAHHICFADKLLVREFIRERLGERVLTHIYWSGTDLSDAPVAILPKKFVIKANNGSGTNLIVSDSATLDWDKARALTRKWMARNHSVHFAEWQYRWIEPRIFIEEFLEGPNGRVPLDYKFFCIHGRVELIQVDVDRFGDHTRALLDREFRVLPVIYKYPHPANPVPKPSCFGDMFEIAERLAADEDFLRVDLYDLGRPICGELTLHPEAGLLVFVPGDLDVHLGHLLRTRGRKMS
jgi:hypothetical protein